MRVLRCQRHLAVRPGVAEKDLELGVREVECRPGTEARVVERDHLRRSSVQRRVN